MVVIMSIEIPEQPSVLSPPTADGTPFEGVCMLAGVHGVGKTSIAQELAIELPRTAVVHASQEIRLLLAGVTREQQMSMKLEDWLGKIVTHFTILFDRGLNDNDHLLFDTHLLVPTTGEEGPSYTSVWSDEYKKYIGNAFMIVAEPSAIKTWHRGDEATTGRTRELTESDIAKQQVLNVREFHALIDRNAIPSTSSIIENRDGYMHEVKKAIAEQIA